MRQLCCLIAFAGTLKKALLFNSVDAWFLLPPKVLRNKG